MQYVTREEIGLKKPKRPAGRIAKPQGVFVHCSDGKHSTDLGRSKLICRQVQSLHFRNGWKDLAYSFLVDDAGTIFEGRGWERAGAHAKGFNSTHHSVCYLGNGKNPTPAALDAIGRVFDEHERRYGTDDHRGHRETAAKACPGSAVFAWLVARREARAALEAAPVVEPLPAEAPDDRGPYDFRGDLADQC